MFVAGVELSGTFVHGFVASMDCIIKSMLAYSHILTHTMGADVTETVHEKQMRWPSLWREGTGLRLKGPPTVSAHSPMHGRMG